MKTFVSRMKRLALNLLDLLLDAYYPLPDHEWENW